MDKNVNEMNDLFDSELMTSSIPIPNQNSLYMNNQNILKENKNYKEDIINKDPPEIKDSKTSSLSKAFDINNKIFSDDDMSLNKSSKLLIKQNNSNNKDEINNKSSETLNSVLLSLNINEIQLEENNDIKKIIPSEIYNYIRYSGNQLINNTKEGLKKLFIYLSDSLNNQKKINGSNDYYYNNDLNSENLLKIYIYIINIINKNDSKHDIINESLFIINLILPLLPTMYINNICIQLIEKFYYKTAFDDLNKNNYLLFKQILRLNNSNFFDKIFLYLKKEKNINIKMFWKKFIFDLIQKNNENCGIDFYLESNENIINILNENHKEKLVEFCLDLFNYDDLNEINSNKDALELIKCISNNKILNNENNKEKDYIPFDEMILEKSKDNETLNLMIKNILNKKEIKKINIGNIDLSSKNNLNSDSYFQGSFNTFNANKKNNFLNQQKENNFVSFNNNYKESLEKYKNNDIFEVMDNNIIYENKEQNNDIDLKLLNKNKDDNNKIDLNEDNLYLYSDKEEESSDKNLIINNNNIRDESLSNYKNKNSIDSVVNYKFSISNKEIMNVKNNNQKNEKKSITNNNKNVSKRTSKISEYYEYFNKKNTSNNNLFSSFSSFSSAKRNSNDIKMNNINDNIDNDNDNDTFKNKENEEHEEINNINNMDKNKIEFNNNNINKANDNIINNDNFLNLINNNNINNKANNNIENKEIINNKNKIIKNKQYNNIPSSSLEKKGFDYENCLKIIDKEKWNEKQQQIKLLKNELNIRLSKENYNKSEIPMDSIINLINKKLNDKQQKLVILILEIVEIIINKLNEIFNEEYLPLLSQSIINNLNDNNIQLRYKAATVILKILIYNKKDFFINQLIDSLKIDKNNMRIEILTILTNYFSSGDYTSSKKMYKNYFELLIEPLILCIEDKINKIRNLSEELIKESRKYLSIDKYYEASKQLYSKVIQDKVNTKIREIYGIEDNNELKKSDISLNSINDYNKDLNKNKKQKERSKSTDISFNNYNNKNYVKKNVGKINKNVEYSKINNIKINQKNINEIKKEHDFDYKNVFKTNQNFLELKNYRNNKDIKLGKNFLSIIEKSNIFVTNQNSNINKNNTSELKPLFQIFSNDFMNKCIIPFDKDLFQIISQINKVILNIPEKNFKSDFIPNLDIILEFIIRLFEQNLINKNFKFIKEYISLINNIYEKIVLSNIKLSQIEYNMILHSLIFLEKYDKNDITICLKNFYKLISIDRLFRILFDYNDFNDIETQKYIVELFLSEFDKGNIDLNKDNIFFVKKIIKFFYNDDLCEIGKDFFKDIYKKIGDKNFEEIISRLNKQEKNILMKNIDFLFLKPKEKETIKTIKNKNNYTNFKIDLSEMIETENNPHNKKENNIVLKNIPINNQKEIITLLNELNSSNEEFNIELYNNENDKNNNEILSNKLKLISRLNDAFEESNYQKSKNILIQSIDLILDILSKEINFFFNLNTMLEDCSNNIIKYTQEIISIFFFISSKQEIVSLLKENILNKLIILFLNYLEIDKEEGISEINEVFNDILQKINKITLNIIQKGQREIIIIILIKLISNFKEESDMSLLAINCLVKLIKITNFNKINIIDILTEIIIAVDDEELFNNKKINELFLKSIKKLLNQLVVQKKYNILKDYQIAINRCNIQDNKVSNWIQKILEHNKF